jgi:hypothetical protein
MVTSRCSDRSGKVFPIEVPTNQRRAWCHALLKCYFRGAFGPANGVCVESDKTEHLCKEMRVKFVICANRPGDSYWYLYYLARGVFSLQV